MIHGYRFLSDEDKSRLRLERVRSLEADVYRAELALEDAMSTAEIESLHADIAALQRRLEPHYEAMRLPQHDDGDHQHDEVDRAD